MQQQQNMQNIQNQQTFMPQPPNIISTKDELYLKDIMSWNLLAVKKAHFYAQHCTDPEVKAAIDQAGRMHQRHYQKILNHIQGHIKNSTQPTETMQ